MRQRIHTYLLPCCSSLEADRFGLTFHPSVFGPDLFCCSCLDYRLGEDRFVGCSDCAFACLFIYLLIYLWVPAGSPSRGGDVKVCVLDINQPSLPTPFTLFFSRVCFSLMALSLVFHSRNSPRQLSVFSLCSPSLISASLILSTIYLFLKVHPAGCRFPCWVPAAYK